MLNTQKLRKGIKKASIIILISFLFINLVFLQNTLSNDELELKKNPNTSVSYTTVSPFIIDNDGIEGSTWAQISKQAWCSGSGTQEDPYSINNIKINGLENDYCIAVKNSDVYFKITSCNFYHSKIAAVLLSSAKNGNITNNKIENNDNNGIEMYNSDENYIHKNILKENLNNGIHIKRSKLNRIEENTISDNKQGLTISSSEKTIISQNLFISNYGSGLDMIFSDSNNITSNQLVYNHVNGITLIKSDNNMIDDNIFHENGVNGLKLSYSNNNLISNNQFYYNYQSISQSFSKDNITENNEGYDDDVSAVSLLFIIFIVGIAGFILILILIALLLHIRERKRYKEFIRKKRIDKS